MEIQENIIVSFPSGRILTSDEVPSSEGPIQKKMMATLAQLKCTQYPDTFDWTVYDKIAAKFDEPPRGGVVFNTTLKLVNYHATCTKCLYALELDTYGRGCFHNCTYCYAKDQLTTYRYWNNPMPFPVNMAEIRKIFYTVFETDHYSKWRDVLEQKVAIRIGSMSDSFQWLDTKYGITKELLKILKYYNYPHLIFTRSDLVAHDDYIDLLDPTISAVHFSVSGNNHQLVRQIEPGAPSFKRRMKALHRLHDAGIVTCVRVNPLFPTHPDGYYTDHTSLNERFPSRESVPKLELYDEDFIPQIAESGVKSVVAGFVRLSGNAINSISKQVEIDFKSFFKPELRKGGNGDNVYSPKEIAQYYKIIQAQCATANLRFSTCYIGTGIKEFYQHQDLWTNKTDCCDIIGRLPSFRKSSQDISWETRLKHAPNKAEALIAKNEEEIMDSESDAPKPQLPRRAPQSRDTSEINL